MHLYTKMIQIIRSHDREELLTALFLWLLLAGIFAVVANVIAASLG